MFEELCNQNIIVELKKLVKNADEVTDLDSYTDFMREVILNTYGVN